MISSPQNSFIKQVLNLIEKSRERKKSGLFVIEGVREMTLAKKGRYTFKHILFCAEIFEGSLAELTTTDTEIIEISTEVYAKIAYRTTTEGVLAVAKSKQNDLEELRFKTSTPLILVAEAPEKPGNIGALLRTADAAGLDAVIIANPRTDMYNPNIIRSSVGCLFTNQIATAATEEIITYLIKNNIPFYSATLQDSTPYHTCDFRTASALVVGTEATGLSDLWRTKSAQNIRIPMQGDIDSLNVSVAAGILIFEAKRQRGFH